jgi:hypothetical protein
MRRLSCTPLRSEVGVQANVKSFARPRTRTHAWIVAEAHCAVASDGAVWARADAAPLRAVGFGIRRPAVHLGGDIERTFAARNGGRGQEQSESEFCQRHGVPRINRPSRTRTMCPISTCQSMGGAHAARTVDLDWQVIPKAYDSSARSARKSLQVAATSQENRG